MSEREIPASFLNAAPSPLGDSLHHYWESWCDACAQHDVDPFVDDLISMQQLGFLFACSDYIARTAIRTPQSLYEHLQEGLDADAAYDDQVDMLRTYLDSIDLDDIEELRRRLRMFRNHHCLRIAIRDLLGRAPVEQLLREQSELATCIIDSAAARVQQRQADRLGMPRTTDGRQQRLVVLAMGKLGGIELNFSSDVDLIFCYPEDGDTDARRSVSNHEYFVRVIRELVPLLDDHTEDGFVYRVDTRLRPYGNSGPMAMSFSAMENYYESQGREWERYAMIKARAISGDAEDIEQLERILQPFVYRRYLDYSVFQGLREMRAMIEEQVKRRAMQHNIKLGAGGIREIEFIVQTFQLIRGGQDVRLQAVGLLDVLRQLGELGVLHQDDVDDLIASYRYLRVLENRLQIEADQQQHELPTEERLQQKLVLAMGCSDWDELNARVSTITGTVRRLFDGLIQQQEPAGTDAVPQLQGMMKHYLSGAHEHAESSLEILGGELERQQVAVDHRELELIAAFGNTAAFQNATAGSRDLAAELLVVLLQKLGQEHASYTLPRLLAIMQAVMGRPVYLSMMLQHAGLQGRLLWLCQSGSWFTDQIRAMPILLDDLIESNVNIIRPIREQLAVELDNRINAVPADDAEQVLECLRVFKQSGQFRVAMLDVIGEHKVTDLSDLLSDIAELLVVRTLQLAWDEVVGRYGRPCCEVDGVRRYPGMAVIAYGKLGGVELGYGSDLDMVFIHNSQGNAQHTDGDRQVENHAFFARVVQKFLHYMGTRTLSGVLYEVDTRLRPDGTAGLMVCGIGAFERYQQERAWTWEHQALVRARAITGDPNAMQEFARIRGSALVRVREWSALARDVVDMRIRMREHHANTQSGPDLKQDPGGLVDIEFITQAGVLQLAADRPALLDTTATVQLLARLGELDWLSAAEVAKLSAAYVTLRRAHNYRTLGVEQATLIERCQPSMQDVSEVWNRLFRDYE